MSLSAGFALPTTLPTAAIEEALVHRICSKVHAAAEPVFRRTATYRFDDPARGFSTLYCAPDFVTCFLETVVRGAAALGILRAGYDARAAALLLLDAARLRLVDLFSTGAVSKLGLDLATLASATYADSQRLAGMIHAHAARPHGILYRSRYDPDRPAMVLFGRSRRHVRLFPGTAPEPFARVPELAAGVRNQIPFILV